MRKGHRPGRTALQHIVHRPGVHVVAPRRLRDRYPRLSATIRCLSASLQRRRPETGRADPSSKSDVAIVSTPDRTDSPGHTNQGRRSTAEGYFTAFSGNGVLPEWLETGSLPDAMARAVEASRRRLIDALDRWDLETADSLSSISPASQYRYAPRIPIQIRSVRSDTRQSQCITCTTSC